MESTILPSKPGTYALVLVNWRTGPLRVGRLGTLHLKPGVYVYIGSAFGPGGLAARIRHHAKTAARPHWHVDYLRAVCQLTGVWFTTASTRLEHAWAGELACMNAAVLPMLRFGSSDCDCPAHLIWFGHEPSATAFRRALGASGEGNGVVTGSWSARAPQ